MSRFCRLLTAFLACLLLVTLLSSAPVCAQESEDSQLFLSGFNAYQQKDYPVAVSRLSEVLRNFPDSSLRDMTLFWLARANYKTGNRQDAARYLAQFIREYPDNPLKNTVEEELLTLAAQYEKNQGTAIKVATAEKAAAEKKKTVTQDAETKAAAELAEKAKILKAKAEADRIAREKAEAERLAAIKRDEEKRQAAAEAERVAQLKAETERAAAAKAEAERIAQTKAAREAEEKAQALKAKAEAERLAAIKRDEEKRQAAAEAERVAQLKAETERAAVAKAKAERIAKEQAAAEQRERELKRAAARKDEDKKLAAEKLRQDRAGLKEKAIAEYKTILERFPGTPAASAAANRLKELGVAISAPATSTAFPSTNPATTTAQVLTLEVAQYAAFEFTVHTLTTPVEVARKTSIPFEIQNRGNGPDSFYLASGFPAEFNARFAAAAAPELTINQTPQLAAGETFKGVLLLNLPAMTIDGLRIAYPVKAASQFMAETSQSRVVSITAAAPLLRAVIKSDKTQLLPGEKLQYRLTIMNLGSTTAQDITLRLNYPAQYQPAEGTTAGFRQEMDAALVLDGITLKPGESRELTAGFSLKSSALAKEELMVRADLFNNSLQIKNTFLSNASFVLPVSGLTVKLATDRVKAVPGQTVSIPVRIINNGNQRERFNLSTGSVPFRDVVLYHDLNRDGLRQPGEPSVNSIGPLGPKEEAALLIEVATSKGSQDGAVEKLSLTAVPESSPAKSVTVDAQVSFSRPVVQLIMKGRGGRMVPGELLTVELDILNRGSNLAKLVDLQVTWPEQLELVTTDQDENRVQTGTADWRFSELGAGEKRTIKASFRIKTGTVVGTGLQLKSMLTYQDQIGNRY